MKPAPTRCAVAYSRVAAPRTWEELVDADLGNPMPHEVLERVEADEFEVQAGLDDDRRSGATEAHGWKSADERSEEAYRDLDPVVDLGSTGAAPGRTPRTSAIDEIVPRR